MVSREKVKRNKEKDCVLRLQHILEAHGQVRKVSGDVRPGCSSTLRREWEKLTGGTSLRLQPQIDLLLEAYTFDPHPYGNVLLCGIEVKYFEKSDGSFNWPFYAGIDEAIATLNYGLDGSALWHVFSPTTTKKDLDQFGASFWIHIALLRLPVEYTMMVDTDSDFDVYNLRPRGNGLECYYLCKLSEIRLSFTHPNPLRNKHPNSELRRTLYDWRIAPKKH